MKRILFLFVSLVLTISAFAQSYAGRTYRYSTSEGGGKLTISVEFTSGNLGIMSVSATYQGQNQTDYLGFAYQIEGNTIYVTDENGDTGWYRIGKNDTLILEDGSGQSLTLKRVTSGTSKSSGSKSKKRK